jgi:hypothetical protein
LNAYMNQQFKIPSIKFICEEWVSKHKAVS